MLAASTAVLAERFVQMSVVNLLLVFFETPESHE